MTELETKERILQTAIKLFEKKGYHRVSVDEIIEVSGTSKGALYYNFKSKEEILFTIHDRYIQYALEKGYECYNSWNTPIERLAAIIKDLLIGIDKFKASVTIFFQEYRYLTGQYFEIVKENRDKYGQLMLKIIEEGIESGEIRGELPSKILAMAIFGMVDWTYIWYRKNGQYSIEEIADIFVDIILNSVLTDDLRQNNLYANFFLKNKFKS